MKKYLIYISLTLILAAIFFSIGVITINHFIASKPAETQENALASQEQNSMPEVSPEVPSPTGNPAQKENNDININIATENVPSNNESSFSFAEIGDTQSFSTNPNGNLQKAVRSLNEQSPAFIIATGDLLSSCDGGSKCDSKYSSWKKILGPLANKTYAVQGNHDRTSKDKSDSSWLRAFNFPMNGPEGFKGFTYSFDYKNSHFVALDSEKPREHAINDTQRKWLEQDLSKNTKENTFVFFHEPAFRMCQDPDNLGDDPSERNALWDTLKKHKVTAVFNGHCHMFARKVQDGIHEFLLGSTDSKADDLLQPGMTDYGLTGGHYYAIISVSGKKIDYKLYSVDGNLLHNFSF
jgi:predicted phosphodiesterase